MSSERSNIFSDSEGKPSMMRVKTFICVLAAVALALYQGTAGEGIDHIVVVELLAAGIGGKLYQKRQELHKKLQELYQKLEEHQKTNRNEKST